jgi:MFS family permease
MEYAASKANEKLWSLSFVLIIGINFLVFINHIMVLSTFPFYIESLGGSEALAGLAATIFSFVAVLCRPFIGWLLDGGKRRVILGAGLAGMLIAPVGYLALPMLAAILAFRMLHGFALACSNTTSSTIASDVIPKKRFAEGMGMFGMATALATACGPALGLGLMDLGYNVLFTAAAAIAAAALILFCLLKTPAIEAAPKPLSLKGLVDRDALPASTIMLVFLLTFGALENFLAVFASDQGLPGGGVFFAVMACMLLLVRVFLGKLADRRGEGIFVYTCNAAMFTAFLLLAFIPNTVTYFTAAILAGYGFGGLEPALQSMAVHIAPPDKRGAANSTFLCAYDIGIGLGGGLAGLLITLAGYPAMFAILSIANVVSVALYLFWGRKHPSSLAPKK